MSVMTVPRRRSLGIDGRHPSSGPLKETPPLRRLCLLVAAALPLTTTLLAVQPARADDPTELIQDELRVSHAPDGTPQTIVISRVVNAAGETLRTSTETIPNPQFRAQEANS